MSIPYGEVTYGKTASGAGARYEVQLTPEVELELLGTYTFSRLDLRDIATHVYRWSGERGRMVGRPRAPGEPARGEIGGLAIDQSVYEHWLYTRVGLTYQITREHALRWSVTPQLVWRIGDDHVPTRVDLMQLRDSAKQVVGGMEYVLNLFDDRLENVAFGKF